MKKNNGLKRKAFFSFLFFLATLLMGIGYAALNDIVLSVDVQANANVPQGVFIQNVERIYPENSVSTINNYSYTTLSTTITLGSSNEDYEIYQITIKNNSPIEQSYMGITYDEEFFLEPNNSIIFEEVTEGNEIITVGDIIAPYGQKTFNIVFKYCDECIINSENTLSSIINFHFAKKDITITLKSDVTIEEDTDNEWTISNGVATKQKAYGETYGKLPVLSKEGYTFKGWYLNFLEYPDDYQRLAYLENNGSKSVLANVTLKKDDIIKTGSSTNTSGNYKTIIAANGVFELYYNYPYVGTWQSISIIEGTKNGIIYGQKYDHTTRLNAASSTLEFFSYNNNYFLNGKIYYVEVVRNNVTVYYFIPSIRKSDNVAGFYDAVGKIFYAERGNGSFGYEFSEEKDIVISSPRSSSDLKIESDTTIKKNYNHELYALFEGNKYNVTLNPDYAFINSTINCIYGEKPSNVPVISRIGYSFDGYYTGRNGEGEKYFNNNGTSTQNWNIASNTTLYANWLPKQYTITFDSNGGNEAYQNRSVSYDQAVDGLPMPTRSGYTFKGWAYDLVPNEYQQLDYIESTSNQYIITDYIALKDDIFITKSSPLATGNYKTIIGAGNHFELYYYVPIASGWSGVNITTGAKAGIELGEVYTHESLIKTNVTNAGNVSVFAYNAGYNLQGRVYDVQWIRGGQMYVHLVPCYRKSDGKTGMYDITNQVFYPNKSTTEFVFTTPVTSSYAFFNDNDLYKFAANITLHAIWEEN